MALVERGSLNVMRFPVFLRTVFTILLICSAVYMFSTSSKPPTNRIIDTKNVDSRLLLDRSYELIRQGKYDEAQDNLMIVLQFEPNNVYANELLAKVLVDSKQTDKNILKLKDVTDKRPDYKAVWTKLAILYELNGDFENARKARETADKLEVI